MTYPNQFPPQQPPPRHADRPRTPFWRSRKGAAVLLAGGLLAAVVVAGNSGSNSSTTSSGAPRVTYSAAPPVTAPSPQQPAAASGPLTSFSDGTYEVGTAAGQVAPGTYKSTGPASPSGICYSARLKHNDGEPGDILDNDVTQGPAILTVKASDGYVEVTGCTFTKTG